MVSAERKSHQMWESQDQNRRSNEVNLARLFAERRSTPIWCRRARFSSSRAARERKIERKAASSVERTLSIARENAIGVTFILSDRSEFSRTTNLPDRLQPTNGSTTCTPAFAKS